VFINFSASDLPKSDFAGVTAHNGKFTVTNKSYLAMKTICFDGATMDKLTYAALKGLRVIDLSKVTVI